MQISHNSIICNLFLNSTFSFPTLNNGASGSLFTHTIVCDSFIPAWCWIDPLTPRPIYKDGVTTFPVCPTCRLDSIIPISTAARVPPTAAPSFSANATISPNCSLLPTPRPPTTTRDAIVRSGRSIQGENTPTSHGNYYEHQYRNISTFQHFLPVWVISSDCRVAYFSCAGIYRSFSDIHSYFDRNDGWLVILH